MKKLLVPFFAAIMTLSAALLLSSAVVGQALEVPGAYQVQTMSATWHDDARDRDVPVRIYYPAGNGSFPVIIFSHGLGGSRDGYEYLGRHWASHGYISVHPTHLGSDSSLLQEQRPFQALRSASQDPANAVARPRDVSFVIDTLTRLSRTEGQLPFHPALDHIGVAGHSFGGYTTLASAGETSRAGAGTPSLGDPRIKAAIAMSAPARPGTASALDAAYRSITIPTFVMTGTRDDSPVGETKAADRRIPFDHLGSHQAYLLIFAGGDHMLFSGRSVPGRDQDMDTRDHALILASSTAFWDAFLKADAGSRDWLGGGGFAHLLGASGTFEVKGAPR